MTGEEFKVIRESLGLTQDELGKILGIGRAYVAKLESSDRAITAIHVAFMKHLLLECEMMKRKDEGESSEPFPFTREEGELLLKFKKWLDEKSDERRSWD